jgi:hypothetical protein
MKDTSFFQTRGLQPTISLHIKNKKIKKEEGKEKK